MISNVSGSIDPAATARRKWRGADRWLSLAAAPTFATMALLTAVQGGGMPDMVCLASQHASPLGGMVPMYLLMSAFHLRPWLKLILS
ncbi:MAG: hypothetical protein ACREDL_14245 [Bradyrhizobium sp.]